MPFSVCVIEAAFFMRSKDKLADTKIMAENLLGFNLWSASVDKKEKDSKGNERK